MALQKRKFYHQMCNSLEVLIVEPCDQTQQKGVVC